MIASLKAHKQLPRRNFMLGQNPRLRHTKPVNNLNKRIQSWIPDPASYEAQITLDAPPTPPPTLEGKYKSWIDDDALKYQVFDRAIVKWPMMRKVQLPANSPPTPDNTPQKKRESTATVQTMTESRTESFRTANEDFQGSEEAQVDGGQGHRSYQKKWEQKPDAKTVGLGLGLESDDEPTPTIKTAGSDTAGDNEFISFDGVWGGATPTRIHDHFTERRRKAQVEKTPLVDHDEPPSPTSIRDAPAGSRNISPHSPIKPDCEETQQAPASKTSEAGSAMDGADGRQLLARMRAGRYHPVTLISFEDDPTANTNSSPRSPIETDSADMQPTSTPKTPEAGPATDGADGRQVADRVRAYNKNVTAADDKRISQASTSSTVTAMVVENTESPPRRTQTLRRTGNFIDAREVEGSLTTSPSLRRQKRDGHKPPIDLRKTFAKDALALKHHSPKPSGSNGLVVLPDRRPSLQSSGSGSNRVSRTFSMTSPQPSSRPTTAPEEISNNHLSAPRPQRRSISVVIQQARPVRQDTKAVQEANSPVSPTPQALTRTDLSRSASVTSGALKMHYVASTPTKSPSSSPVDDGSRTIQKPSIDGAFADYRPQSDIVTPFSLRSTHSSTPGTLEVNEATALNIFPHTNRSILVIQELKNKDNQENQPSSAAMIASNASIAMPGKLSPVLDYDSPEIRVTDSPLLNPRDPPPPPDLIQVIPPTPANANASSEVIIAAAEASKANRPNAPLSNIRRAFSARHTSESVKSKSSFRRTFSLRNPNPSRQVSVRRRYSFSSNDGEEQHLHPSWRPRRLQHQESDSDSDFGNGILHPTSPLPPVPKRTVSLTDRITSTFRKVSARRPRRSASLSTTHSNNEPLPYEVVDDAIKRRVPLQRRLTNSLRLSGRRQANPLSRRSSWGGQTGQQSAYPGVNTPRRAFSGRSLSLRGARDRWERRQDLREEDKRERRREQLRGAIDVVGPGYQPKTGPWPPLYTP